MPAPAPVWLCHFTHVNHLPTISADGLSCDSDVGSSLSAEAGEPAIKARRLRTAVPVPPFGVVGEYVPFYFAPRSPMLSAIHHGRVPTFAGNEYDLVYLCTTVEHLESLGLTLTFSDRNAVLRIAEFRTQSEDWREDGFIDWPLMKERYWADPDHPDWRERRMAECLAFRRVPWEGILAIATFDERRAATVSSMLERRSHRPKLLVRPGWYF